MVWVIHDAQGNWYLRVTFLMKPVLWVYTPPHTTQRTRVFTLNTPVVHVVDLKNKGVTRNYRVPLNERYSFMPSLIKRLAKLLRRFKR